MQIVLNVINKLRFCYWQLAGHLLAKVHGVKIGKKCRFYGLPIFARFPDSKIILGDRVVLCSDSRFTALGVNHPVVLRTLRSNAEIIIGDDCGLSGTSICAAQSVCIGKEVLIGANVSIFDTDFHAKSPENRRYCSDPEQIAVKPVTINTNVFIGTQSVICKGVTIGENSIIGSGAVVVKNVEASRIYAGNPAREIAHVA